MAVSADQTGAVTAPPFIYFYLFMKNKLKTFTVVRRTITVETMNIAAKDRDDAWKRMDDYEYRQGKNYKWELQESDRSDSIKDYKEV